MAEQAWIMPPELAVEEPPISLVELDDALAPREEPPEETPAVRRWRIEATDAAEWAMRHLAEAQAQVEAIEAQAAEWRDRINDWTARVSDVPRRRIAFFTERLAEYGIRRREETGTATVKLPSGYVTTRPITPKVVIADEAKWEQWAAANVDHEVVRAKYELAKTETKDALLITDDVIALRHTAVLSCGHQLIKTTAPTVQYAFDLDVYCIECEGVDPDGQTNPDAGVRCKLVDVEVETLTRPLVRDKDTGFPVEWAGVEPGGVSATVKVTP